MKRKSLKPKVFFNASVILSGLHTSSGGSGKLLSWVKQKRIIGVISEVVLDEVLTHAEKLNLNKTSVETLMLTLFFPIRPAPEQRVVNVYSTIVIDQGDAHILASSGDAHADFLVTLDKKHLLILQHTIKKIHIVSPGELLEQLRIS